MTFYLDPQLLPHFSSNISLFDQLMNLKGEVFRQQKNRLTQRVALGDKAYFIKQYKGISLKEIIKNMLNFRLPISSARNEWEAIAACRKLGIAVPQVLAYGKRGWNPLTSQSFILMEALLPTQSLEEITQNWEELRPSFTFKRHLIEKVATIARSMHQSGMNHRDFYLCHFLLSLPIHLPLSQLYLIDLHRAQSRRRLRRRWVIKDLAGLYFSSKNIGLTKRDFYRFIKTYLNRPAEKCLHDIFRTQEPFWQKVKRRGEQLYRDHS